MCDIHSIRVPPLVSVIAATSGKPATLGASLASVRAQTFTDYELIVVSYNEPPEMVVATRQAALMNGANFLHLETGEACDARIFGVSQAMGKWISFLHVGDQWLPGQLGFQIELVKQCGADLLSIDDSGSMLVRKTAFNMLIAHLKKDQVS